MTITDKMIAEDEKRWHYRNILTELGYCGYNMPDRKNMTNDDIRFYAYVMRKAYAYMRECNVIKPLKLDEEVIKLYKEVKYQYSCGNCLTLLRNNWKACPICGKEIKWQ